MPTVAELLVLFVALYPVVTAAVWVAGGALFHVVDERVPELLDDADWPGVTVLIPAFNEGP